MNGVSFSAPGCYLKKSFLDRISAATKLMNTDSRIMIKKPHGESAKGIPAVLTFIPYALNTIVGMDITMVIMANTFMTIFKLLDMTEAKASIMPLKIPL